MGYPRASSESNRRVLRGTFFNRRPYAPPRSESPPRLGSPRAASLLETQIEETETGRTHLVEVHETLADDLHRAQRILLRDHERRREPHASKTERSESKTMWWERPTHMLTCVGLASTPRLLSRRQNCHALRLVDHNGVEQPAPADTLHQRRGVDATLPSGATKSGIRESDGEESGIVNFAAFQMSQRGRSAM